jgi:hypothetical protein
MNHPTMPEKCALRFMSAFKAGDKPDMACIKELCEQAMGEDKSLAATALKSLYGTIIEGLCDDFSDQGVRLNNQVLLHLLFKVASSGKLEGLEQLLTLHGLTGPGAALQRYETLLDLSNKPLSLKPTRIIVLSRVTIGADIMITSIVVQRLKEVFPHALIELLGSRYLVELFHNCAALNFTELDYEKNCSLPQRIGISVKIYNEVRLRCMGYGEENVLLVDPDSRLSQLGLIPIMPLEQTRYFCSRSPVFADHSGSLAASCNRWLDYWLGSKETFTFPAVFLSENCLAAARRFSGRLRQAGSRVIVISFGVGRNEDKRIADPFEEMLLHELLLSPDRLVILDSGRSAEGLARVEKHLSRISAKGFPTAFFAEKDLSAGIVPFRNGAIGFRGSIGMIGALIAEADGFFGYDSCCQHLAAASGTQGVAVFSGHPSERFLHRWRPVNRQNSIEVVSSPNGWEMRLQETGKLVEQVARLLDRKLRQN